METKWNKTSHSCLPFYRRTTRPRETEKLRPTPHLHGRPAEHNSVSSRDVRERVALVNNPVAPAVAAFAVDSVDGPVLYLDTLSVPATVDVWEEEEEEEEGKRGVRGGRAASRRVERVRSGRLTFFHSPGSKELIASNVFFNRKAPPSTGTVIGGDGTIEEGL